jgi:peptide/nickel transport system ATP-binding protein
MASSPGSGTKQVLDVADLRIGFANAPGRPVVDGLSFRIHTGEVLAMVGESGSGKSITALAIIRLLPPGAAVRGGRISFGDEDILAMPPDALNHLRGGRIAMLFQQPHAMLDPTSRVGTQIAEPLRLHRGLGKRQARQRVLELLTEVGIPEPAVRARCYAHELSGGMAQRVMMAAALSGNPELLIADEPTTALDVTIQAQILKLLDQERRKRHLAVLLITHDLSIVSAVADRVAVMYAGRIVEQGPTPAILNAPRHPYTQALVRCSLLQMDTSGELFSLPGSTTRVHELQQGCRFLPRCTIAAERGLTEHCSHAEPGLRAYDHQSYARCWALPAESAQPPQEAVHS